MRRHRTLKVMFMIVIKSMRPRIFRLSERRLKKTMLLAELFVQRNVPTRLQKEPNLKHELR